MKTATRRADGLGIGALTGSRGQDDQQRGRDGRRVTV